MDRVTGSVTMQALGDKWIEKTDFVGTEEYRLADGSAVLLPHQRYL
jgi:hypothetical protein